MVVVVATEVEDVVEVAVDADAANDYDSTTFKTKDTTLKRSMLSSITEC